MQSFFILDHNSVFLNVSLAGRQDIQLELLSFTICRGASQHMNRQGLPPSSSPGGEDQPITGFLLSAVKEHLCHEEITRQTNLFLYSSSRKIQGNMRLYIQHPGPYVPVHINCQRSISNHQFYPSPGYEGDGSTGEFNSSNSYSRAWEIRGRKRKNIFQESGEHKTRVKFKSNTNCSQREWNGRMSG